MKHTRHPLSVPTLSWALAVSSHLAVSDALALGANPNEPVTEPPQNYFGATDTRNVRPPLHIACAQNSANAVDIVRTLIRAGGLVDGLDQLYRTPLDIAVRRKNLPLVKFLLQAGAPVNVKDIQGVTPLNNAVAKSHADMVDILLTAGADANDGVTEPGGYSFRGGFPLEMAKVRNSPRIIQALLNAGAMESLIGKPMLEFRYPFPAAVAPSS